MSSLIEQAAKRLEELRRATGEAGEIRPVGVPIADTVARPPTPEALMRVIDAQSPPLGRIGEESRAPGSATRGSVGSRYIELNLDHMRQCGFITPDSAKSQLADEFRVIKRPILRNAFGAGGARVRNGNLVMVTSALPREGKTFTSVNLALSIAMEIDSKVLLVDGDVAHPSIPGLLGVPHGPGLLDILTRADIDFADAMIRTNVDKLTLLPAGSRHRRSTELLASEQMVNLLHELGTRYHDRIVIFDSPPLLATTEARVLATHMGQIVMVVAADATSQHAVTQALATIESCEIVLMALNKASRTDVGSYYGYYGNEES